MTKKSASPLRKQLTWMAMVCSIVALVTTAVALGAYEWVHFRKNAYAHLTLLTTITARNCSAAVAFADVEDARRILAGLDEEPSVLAAALYDSDGGHFVGFRHRGTAEVSLPPSAPEDGTRRVGKYLQIVAPVMETKRFGTLLVLADLGEVRERLTAYSIVLACTTIVSGLIAYLLSGLLKERIVAPVQALAEAALRVQTKSDYGIRVAKQADDEIGALTEAFNAMLAHIQTTEAEVARSAERLRIAVESAEIGTWDWDMVRDTVVWNDRSYQIFAIPPGTPIVITEIFRHIHPDDIDEFNRVISGAIRACTDFTAEMRYLQHGELARARHLLVRGRFLEVKDGHPQRATGVTIDVTDRRLSELRLIESELRFRAVAEKVPAMIWSCDSDLNRDYFNKTWLAFVGRPIEREIGKGWQDSVLGLDLQRWGDVVGGAAAQRDPYSIEYRIRRADGAVRWLIETASPRYAADGAFAGYLGSCIDITARKETEEELETHVRQRTRELQAANQELESFSYSVSHDLRGPIRAIEGFAEIALEEIDSGHLASAKERIGRVLKASERMNKLIDAFISMARVTRAELRLAPVDLTKLAEEIAGFLQQANPSRDVELVIAPGLSGNGDERLLRIALENLLSNAWKFTSKKEHARVEFAAEYQDGEKVFYVRDNGAGFDDSLAHKLFNAFERLHPVSQFEGMGVGLNTVFRVIERHGGRVWASAEVGEGATFYFTLPAQA